jgi:methylated-DNA-[protein]-cysteine S-methyltransferase
MRSRTVRLLIAPVATPTGRMFAVTGDYGRLKALEWDDHSDRMATLVRRYQGPGVEFAEVPTPPAPIGDALERYFAGDLIALDALETDPGGTPFQRECWAALRRIPPGETRSYSQQAATIGRPAATRAVGLANGANPIAIVVPCHRVVGADGSLTGFGGGLERKRWLLEHEGAVQPALL